MCIGIKLSRLQKKQSGEVSEPTQMSNAQNPCDIPLYTDWFIEILIMAFYNPHKTIG